MTQTTQRSGIDIPDFSTTYNETQRIQREAEIARSYYLQKMVKAAAIKVADAFRHIAELFAFAQRMNTNARL